MKVPRRRRSLLVGGGVLALLIAAALGFYVWALSSTDDSTLARALIWRESDVGDQHRFPARRIPAGAQARPLPRGEEVQLVLSGDGETLDEFLRETDTLAFVVVHRDRVVYERYFDGATRGSLQTSFSAAKSFVSTLVGIAIDAGLLGSVDDPVTKYLPELAARDPRFRQITLRHLLTMSSGIRYREGGFLSLGDDTYTYYGVDLRDVALNRTRIEAPPGTGWQYNNYHPLLLGLVLERSTGMSVSDFMARRLWQPLGAERTRRGTSTRSNPGSRSWRAASTRLRATTPGSACSSSTRASGTVDASSPSSGCVRRPAPALPPTRRTPTATGTSGGSTSSGQGASTRWGNTVSTSTSLPTQTRSSFASAATGELPTSSGWRLSARSATSSSVDRDNGVSGVGFGGLARELCLSFRLTRWPSQE